MIQITLKDNEFSYDMRALAQAFCPEKNCIVQQREEWAGKEGFSVCWEIDGIKEYEEYFPAPYTKNEVKKGVYGFLAGYTGKKLPWGILTGIRPAKIPLRMLMEGTEEEKIREILQNEYMCSSQKAALALHVAKKEAMLTAGIDHENSISIYIGIPFCPSICAYCSFSSYPLRQYADKVDDYLDALQKEIKFAAEQYADRKLQAVYVGGGTPTSLGEAQFERLLSMIQKYLPMEASLEFTVEAGRPDSITEGKLRLMKKYGVSRISINPQSMKQHTLDLLGRKHTTDEIRTVFAMARKLGFDNINMDLIAGLPEEDMEDFARTLSQVEEFDPDSITIHTLVIKRASQMRRKQLESGGEIRREDRGIAQMQDYSQKFCMEHGYEPYYMYRQKNKAATTRNTNQENVAYAKPGKECLYNIFIMEEMQTILALGSGGSSKYVFHGENRMERVENVKSVDDYISRIDEMIERKRRF
ncbi:MAG: coproporphyrinogen dehydrogenase HemZ [Roseburia sp.]|nr:coproporphyrinogen dehydrogenase HemZ [Roseburia sp.]